MTKRKRPTGKATSGSTGDTFRRKGRRSVEESRETRRALLNAAILEFSEKGMSGARIDEIAKRAGLTKGAIYAHFNGREDLLAEASRAAMRSLQMNRIAAEAPDLPTFVDETARRLLSPEGKSARMLISELYTSGMRSDVIAGVLKEWHVDFVKTIEDRVPPGVLSPDAVAMGINLLNLALSHIDVYDSIDVDRDEVLAFVRPLTAALLSET